jgi:hypothetical protein
LHDPDVSLTRRQLVLWLFWEVDLDKLARGQIALESGSDGRVEEGVMAELQFAMVFTLPRLDAIASPPIGGRESLQNAAFLD